MLTASAVHERPVAEDGFTGHYQRVKMYLAEVELGSSSASTDDIRSPSCPDGRLGRDDRSRYRAARLRLWCCGRHLRVLRVAPVCPAQTMAR